jgi:hypothetical protein
MVAYPHPDSPVHGYHDQEDDHEHDWAAMPTSPSASPPTDEDVSAAPTHQSSAPDPLASPVPRRRGAGPPVRRRPPYVEKARECPDADRHELR